MAAPASSTLKGKAMTAATTPRKSRCGDIAPALGDYTKHSIGIARRVFDETEN
jgi:hypothetical protein